MATDGRVKTIYYAGGSQGDERDVVRKMRQGGLDGAALTSVGLSMIYSGIKVLELPRMFESVKQLDCVRRHMWRHFRKQFERRGYMLGEPGDVGWMHFLSRKPVGSMKQLRSQKVWVWTDDQVIRRFFKELGLGTVPLGVPDVRQALSTGRIDAAYGSPLAAVALQWSRRVRRMSELPIYYGIGATVVRKDVWSKAKQSDQETERTINVNVATLLRRRVRGDNRTSKSTMRRGGVKVEPTPRHMRDALDEAAEKTWAALEGKLYTKWELKTVRALKKKCGP